MTYNHIMIFCLLLEVGIGFWGLWSLITNRMDHKGLMIYWSSSVGIFMWFMIYWNAQLATFIKS